MFAHGGDAERDVVVEGDPQFFRAFDYVFAADAAGEGFVFHAFLHRTHFQIEDAFRGTDVGAGGKEASEFIAGEEGTLERGFARDIAIVGVREDGADEFVAVAAFSKDFRAFGGMLAVGGVVIVRPAFVVEIVKESGEAPGVFVGVIFAGVGADAGFHGKHVFAEGFGLSVFADEVPGVFAGRHVYPFGRFTVKDEVLLYADRSGEWRVGKT